VDEFSLGAFAGARGLVEGRQLLRPEDLLEVESGVIRGDGDTHEIRV